MLPRPRAWVAVAMLAALLAGVALILSPNQDRRALLDQLQRPAIPARGPATPAPTRDSLVRHTGTGYSLTMTLTPNRASGEIALSLRALHRGGPLDGAHIHVGFSMPSMNMWNAYTTALSASTGGHYAANIPVLGMPGLWRLRVDVSPRVGRPFRVTIDDRLAK